MRVIIYDHFQGSWWLFEKEVEKGRHMVVNVLEGCWESDYEQ